MGILCLLLLLRDWAIANQADQANQAEAIAEAWSFSQIP